MKHPISAIKGTSDIPCSIRAILFDLDGVIIDSEPMQLAAFNEALKGEEVELSKEDFIRWCVGRKSRENFAFLREHFGLTATVEELLRVKDEAYQHLLQTHIVAMPGLFSLLQSLKMQKLRLAVASSSRRADIELILERLEIRNDFLAVVSGEEVARGKPDPDIFLEAAQQLGVEPRSCVVLEDTQTGVTAAVKAGMTCIAVPNEFTRNQDFSQAHTSVPSLADVTLLDLPNSHLVDTTHSTSTPHLNPSIKKFPARMFSPYDRSKLLMHSHRIRRMLNGDMVDPITVDIEPTNICNHNCFWCYNRKFRSDHPDTLPKKIMLPLIDSLQDSEIKGIIFSGGGEPLLNPHIDAALFRVAEIGLDCCLYTNGSRMGEHLESISTGCRSINISVDAGSDKTHMLMHKPDQHEGEWENLLENLRLIKECSPCLSVNISYVIHAYNYNEIYALSRQLKQIGIDSLHIKLMVKYNAHIKQEMMDELKQQIAMAKQEISISMTDLEATELQPYPDQCRATPLKGLVAADGKIYVCCRRREPEYCLGDLHTQDFWTIWRSDTHRSILSTIIPSTCGECPQVAYNTLLDHVFDDDEMQANFI